MTSTSRTKNASHLGKLVFAIEETWLVFPGGYIQRFPDWVVTKYMLIFSITHWEATQRVMAAKLTTLTHKIVIQLQLVAESCTICSSRSRRPVRKLLDIISYAAHVPICQWISLALFLYSAFTCVQYQSSDRLPWLNLFEVFLNTPRRKHGTVQKTGNNWYLPDSYPLLGVLY
jgi:hypothetical protein